MTIVRCMHGLKGHRSWCIDCPFDKELPLEKWEDELSMETWEHWLSKRILCPSHNILVKELPELILFAPT